MSETTIVNQQTGEIVETGNQKLVFGTMDPQGIIDKATLISNKLTHIIDKSKLYKEIQGKKHVYAEGWTTMCAMLGVFPSTVYCKRIEREDEIAYEAKVILRHLSGTEVGAGEAICSSRERNWSNRDEYAIKSMAQTRAVGKACRLSFSWIMALAGYEAAPVEEMPIETLIVKPQPKATPITQETEIDFDAPAESEAIEKVQKAMSGLLTEKQRKRIFAIMKSVNMPEDYLKAYIRKEFQKESTKELHYTEGDKLVKWIQEYGTEQVGE